MADRMVVIEHRDGRRVAVTPHDYRHAKVGPEGETYEEQKFRIVGWESGEPYEEPTRTRSAEEPTKGKPSEA